MDHPDDGEALVCQWCGREPFDEDGCPDPEGHARLYRAQRERSFVPDPAFGDALPPF